MEILIPVIILGSLGALFGVGLAFASKRFHVEIDPRLEKIHGLLPGANCGACGGAGCFGFAEAVLEGKMPIDACKVASEKTKEQIAALTGKAFEKKSKKIAVLHCNGGKKANDKFNYDGPRDCLAAALLQGGPKKCTYGCIGFGSCVAVCPFAAITISGQGLPVIASDKCKACNRCVDTCPKKLFSLIDVNHTVYIACNSCDIGKDTKAACPAGCIGCRLCEKACKSNAIHVDNNLAKIDYAKCTSCGDCVKACPVKCIIIRK